jgi:hypothetical protein
VTITDRIAAIEKECAGVWGQSGITDWERQRLAEWKAKTNLSPRQEEILRQIEAKAFGEPASE